MATDLKSRISNILQIDNSDSIEIVDSSPDAGLYLVHWSATANLNQYGALSGVVVDVDNEIVVSRGLPYSPTAILDVLEPGPDGHINITDMFGLQHLIQADKTVIQAYPEGLEIRVFRHQGQTYYSTARKLDLSKIIIGGYLNALDLYKSLGGPGDSLYSEDSSPYVYIFTLVHPLLLQASRENVEDGYLVYWGPRMVSDDESKSLTVPTIDVNPLLNLRQANHYLRYGRYDENSLPDRRLETGERLLVQSYNSLGQLNGIIVRSSSYHWRSEMVGRNLTLRYYELLEGGFFPTENDIGFAQYLGKFPILSRNPDLSIEDHLGEVSSYLDDNVIISWPLEPLDVNQAKYLVRDRANREYNIFLSYLMAVPLHRQREAVRLYNLAGIGRAQIYEMLIHARDNTQAELSERARSVLKYAEKFAENKISRDNVPTLSYDDFVKENLAALADKEVGDSLYHLSREAAEYLGN